MILGWLRGKLSSLYGSGRSGQWPAVRARHLARQPRCMSCSRDKHLEVHHISPVHATPELETADDNLVTLCRDCHFVVGHACDWKAWRPEVVSMAAALRNATVRRVS